MASGHGSMAGGAVMESGKADAYGHGLLPVARALVAEGADYLGVGSLEEGLSLRQAGLVRGEHLVVVGSNRPRLYAAMLAAQSLGAIPVPLYQDAVAAECVFPLNNAEVRFAVVEDQEQVDKLLEILPQCPSLEHIYFDEPRGMRNYAHPQLMSCDRLEEIGLESYRRDPAYLEGEIAKGEADPSYRLHVLESKVNIPIQRSTGGPRYTPVSRRGDRPDAIAWLLGREGVLLGLMDSGAHVSQLCDACMPTDLLGNWVREREVISLERAVEKLTGEPARVFGLDGPGGRGVLREGMAARAE